MFNRLLKGFGALILFCLVCFFFVAGIQVKTGKTLYLDPNAGTNGNGAKSSPFNNLVVAIDSLEVSPPGTELKILPGTINIGPVNSINISGLSGSTKNNPYLINGSPGTIISHQSGGSNTIYFTIGATNSWLEIRGIIFAPASISGTTILAHHENGTQKVIYNGCGFLNISQATSPGVFRAINYGTMGELVVKNCVFIGTDHAIYDQAGNTEFPRLVKNNTFLSIRNRAIWCVNATEPVDQLIVENNIFDAVTGGNGIALDSFIVNHDYNVFGTANFQNIEGASTALEGLNSNEHSVADVGVSKNGGAGNLLASNWNPYLRKDAYARELGKGKVDVGAFQYLSIRGQSIYSAW